MAIRSTTYDYEQSSESGRERHLPVPWSRLADQTPTLGDPAQITGFPAGTQQTGTVINPGTATVDEYVILNVAYGAVYRHNVRNVATYTSGPVEATWRAIQIGDTVYYDAEQDALSGVKLSLAPLQSNGTTPNAIFGHVTMMQDEDSSDFAKGSSGAGSTHVCAVEQV